MRGSDGRNGEQSSDFVVRVDRFALDHSHSRTALPVRRPASS